MTLIRYAAAYSLARVGLRMLERLIKLEGGVAEDDGLAAYALAVLRDALKQLSPSFAIAVAN